MTAHGIDDSITSLASSIEEPLCRYLDQFDDGRSMDRKTFVNVNQCLLENQMIATLEDVYFPDDTHIDYTVHWGNDDISIVTHFTGVVDDDQIIKLEPCRETSSALANMYGSRWKKNIALQVDKKILGMKTWALTQQYARARAA
eukprot:scaffold21250_cov70-Cyclotella_meneghiniana.AAC.13